MVQWWGIKDNWDANEDKKEFFIVLNLHFIDLNFKILFYQNFNFNVCHFTKTLCLMIVDSYLVFGLRITKIYNLVIL